MVGGALLLTRAFGGPLNAAIEFQSVMADVNKVANFTAQEYGEMSSALVDMSKRVPMAASALGEIMASAAQAGIAKEDLVAFTEDAAKMGVAFGISAREAGDAMAGLRSIFQIGQADAVLLGDAVNHLSNSMNATAGDILGFLNRAGSIGKMAGMTQQQVAALGATFIDLKTPPEVAARAFNALAMNLSNASKSTKSAEAAFKALGLSGEGMEQAFRQDAAGAVLTLLDAVKKSSNPIGHLTDIVGQGFADDIAKLADGNEKLRAALGMVGDRANYAGSMLEEYETRSNTVQNSLQILRNRLEAVKLKLGNLSLPVFGTLVNAISAVVGWISRLPAPLYAAAALVAGLAGAFMVGAGALIAFGGFLKVLPMALAAAKAGLAVLRAALLPMKGAFLSALTPALALIAAAYLLRKAWDANFGGIRDAATAIAAGFRMAASASEEGIAKVDAAVAQKLKDAGLWDLAVTMGKVFFRVRVLVRGMISGLRQSWEGIKNMAAAVKEFFAPAIETGKSFLKDLGLMKGAADTNAGTWESWGEIIGKWAPLVLGIAAAFWTLKKVITLAQIAAAAFNFVMSLNPVGLIVLAVVAAIAFMIYNWDVFGKYIGQFWEGIKGIVGGAVDVIKGIWDILVGFWRMDLDLMGQGFRELFGGLWKFFEGWINMVSGALGTVLGLVEWVLKKMGIIEGDPYARLTTQIEALDAPEETKQQLLGQAKALDPETAERVAEDFAGGVSAAKNNPKVMGLMLDQAGAVAPPGTPVPAASGSPTDAPLADASASAKAAGVNVNSDVKVDIEPQKIDIKVDGSSIAHVVAMYAAQERTRRGEEAWASS
jgi:TP901 family phage tail tape measure protein